MEKFGCERILFGSDFPYALHGVPMPPGSVRNDANTNQIGAVYSDIVRAIPSWPDLGLTKAQLDLIMGGNARRLFGF